MSFDLNEHYRKIAFQEARKLLFKCDVDPDDTMEEEAREAISVIFLGFLHLTDKIMKTHKSAETLPSLTLVTQANLSALAIGINPEWRVHYEGYVDGPGLIQQLTLLQGVI